MLPTYVLQYKQTDFQVAPFVIVSLSLPPCRRVLKRAVPFEWTLNIYLDGSIDTKAPASLNVRALTPRFPQTISEPNLPLGAGETASQLMKPCASAFQTPDLLNVL